MKGFIVLLLAMPAMGLAGCASIVTGHNQPISVETRHRSEQISGASCKLNNDKGTWFVTTPGSITVQRSYADLNVHCEKEQFEPGIAVVRSFTKGMAFGNIIFGGFIGAAVDMGSGAAYDYPSLITIEMGRSLTIAPEVASEAAGTKRPGFAPQAP